MNKKKFVICIGAEKAGTTTLHALFESHLDVLTAFEKETGFFYDDARFEHGFSWYIDTYFSGADEHQFLFEADPNYGYFGKCIERICGHIPDARIIFILRNPVHRAFSQFLMMKKWGLEPLDFEHACAAEPERIAKGDWQKGHFGYLDRSNYLPQIRKVLQFFPPQQVYFMKFEDFVVDQQSEYNGVLDWIGLECISNQEEKHANKSSTSKVQWFSQLIHHPRHRKIRQWIASVVGKERALNIKAKLERTIQSEKKVEKLSPETYTHLWQRFSEDIAEIERLTGLDLQSWNNMSQS
ncbi:MAG: sulfotransferase [Gammaproteobacteria bacterium]|jgi:hypothetical protein|nr:sulfotransferase [Gammaproteobacteria bacterium]